MQPRTQEVPCGGLWARPELAATPGGKDILRSVEKPPPPSLPPASKEKGAGGGREVEACRVSSLLPETLGRAEQAMALDSQALYPCQPPQ